MLRSRRRKGQPAGQLTDAAVTGAALTRDAVNRTWRTTAMNASVASAKVRKKRRSACWCLCAIEWGGRDASIVSRNDGGRNRL
ncbi:hypothetical protein A2264_01090 [candidate division WWE3 bacterium RIFOXYA2_FULL_46_9]|uniref:Uncharacterized protein n=1 Tax=candidate division WWE3 bacterium RIFOXYA2_FULL_46_9 TaxID=1802636 RepID=A0A1F4VZH1_UNCKA|nr:MAG: hypothetical protein A2264_01090 [candidate division WWE3 bacterium RIFOXYA2_FULL_46_9]